MKPAIPSAIEITIVGFLWKKSINLDIFIAKKMSFCLFCKIVEGLFDFKKRANSMPQADRNGKSAGIFRHQSTLERTCISHPQATRTVYAPSR